MNKLSMDIGKDNIARISDIREYISTLGQDLKIAAQEIVRQLCMDGGYKAVELNAKAPQSSSQKSTVVFGSRYYHGNISLVGTGAVYDEFGTGEKGQSNPHPTKGLYNLNPYNSGPFVSTHINEKGMHYWFAPTHSADQMYVKPSGYTEGVPSGKQMYNTLQYVREIKGKVIEEKINDVLRTYKWGMVIIYGRYIIISSC